MLFLGTSGWNYAHWYASFYPRGLASREQLTYLSRHFPTVELNASFYRLPSAASFAKWYGDTPEAFRFAVKIPRTISHYKRLQEVEADWLALVNASEPLANKISIYLCQFPPSLRADDAMLSRLESFMVLVGNTRIAFEFRHKTWFEPEVIAELERLRICVVQAESSRYPHSPAGFSPAEYAYFRFHGPRELYSSHYTDEELSYWAELIRQELAAGKDAYVYFDNDFHEYALEDAGRLRDLLSDPSHQ